MSGVREARHATADYITALMVDGGANVAACERAMNEAFEAIDARVRELEAALAREKRAADVESDMLTRKRNAERARVRVLEAALREIASCESRHPQDVVAVARAALAVSPEERGEPQAAQNARLGEALAGGAEGDTDAA